MACRTPVEICAELVRWSSSFESLDTLLQQDATLSFPNENLPVKVCFAKHLRFVEDKLSNPHFYCWPAMFMVGQSSDVDVVQANRLLRPHLPLFVGSNKEEIKLAYPEGMLNERVIQTFNDFYRWVIQYDLTNQWIATDGPFDLNFTDIHPELRPGRVANFAVPDFDALWGVALNDIVLIGS